MRSHTVRFALVALAASTLGARGDPREPGHHSATSIEPRAASRASGCKKETPDDKIPLPIAPRRRRVDLFTPVFSNPTRITNPLFPISRLHQAIIVGFADGEPLRIETTLLPRPIRVDMGDHVVNTAGSQFLAYVGRRIHEVAIDRYAQADDGSVWYFGEDVFNYEHGKVADTEGTWIACKDGPAAMIMAAHPHVGDVWRTENAFPIVFEEITVKKVGQTLPGPHGPIAGGITVQELHLDSELERKTFAPGYGEHSSGTFPNVERVALAVPTNALPGPTPEALRVLLTGARRVFGDARSDDWAEASRTVRIMNAAWRDFPQNGVPRLLGPLMEKALKDLGRAVAAQKKVKSSQAALDVARNGLDLLLQYRSRIAVDFARLELWANQLLIDADARDRAGVASDVAILEWILRRLEHAGNKADEADTQRAWELVRGVRGTAEHDDFAGVLRGTRGIQELLKDRVAYTITAPPATSRMTPVIHEASSDAR